ncbi:phospholipase-like protein [Tanacetum coccineum]
MKKLKENVHAIQVGCQNCGGAHFDKDCLLNEEVKSIEEAKYGEFERSSPFSNGAKYRIGPPRYYIRIDNRPSFGEKRPSLEELMNKHMEESTASLKNLDTQIEQLTKEFHAKVTNEINNSSFDLCKAVSVDEKTPLDNGQHEKTDMLVEMANMTKRSPIGIVENVFVKIDKFLFPSDFVVMDMLNTHNETMILGRPFLATIHAEINVFNKEISLGVRVWPTCDPTLKACNGGIKVYGMNEEGNPKRWYCYLDDDRGSIKGGGLSFPKFLLVKYGEVQKEEEDYKPRPKDYSFKDWLLTKVGHTEVSEPVKKALLKTWLLDCFQEELVKDPRSRRIGKKGHMLDDIWENCKKVQGDNTYWWHDQKSEEEERRQLRINIEEYDPPMVHVETFEIKRYSFDIGQNFICVTKELMDALPLGRENGSRFRDMIRKEVDSGRRIHRKT